MIYDKCYAMNIMAMMAMAMMMMAMAMMKIMSVCLSVCHFVRVSVSLSGIYICER